MEISYLPVVVAVFVIMMSQRAFSKRSAASIILKSVFARLTGRAQRQQSTTGAGEAVGKKIKVYTKTGDQGEDAMDTSSLAVPFQVYDMSVRAHVYERVNVFA